MDQFLHRTQALEQGMTDSILRAAHRRGELARIRPGTYIDGGHWQALARHEQYRIRVHAFAARIDAVVSHDSAAALLQLPILQPDRTCLHATVDGKGGGNRSAHRQLYRTRLDECDTAVVDGIRVTSPMRTALDIACAGTFAQAVCAVESAVRVSDEIPSDVMHRMGRRRGIATARAAIAYASPLTESIGESWSRVLMRGWSDIPEPRMQHEFRSEDGTLIGRTDFDWNEVLIGEFDGLTKYTSDSSRIVVAEKLREDRLRRQGHHVVRWVWADLLAPDRLHRILRDGFDLAHR